MKGDIDSEKLRASVEKQVGRIQKAERARRTLLANTVYLGTLGLIFVLPVIVVTRPTFCTRASERVYSTTSDWTGVANGGSQGAVGDRRAAIRGANAAGAGGL